MKKYSFLYIITNLLFLAITLSTVVPLHAQDSYQYALYNYRNDGEFNAWLNIDVDSITYSCIDTLGVEHDDVVVQEVWTPDSCYRIPIEAIDSIGFRAPKIIYKEEVFHITKEHIPFLVTADTLSIDFTGDIPMVMLPLKGQIVVSDVDDEPFEDGFAGRVSSVENNNSIIRVICDEVGIDDIFEQLVLVGKVLNDTTTTDNPAAKRKQKLPENVDDESYDEIESYNDDDATKNGTHTFSLGKIVLNNNEDTLPFSFTYSPVLKLDYLVYVAKNKPSHYRFVGIGEHKFTMKVKLTGKTFGGEPNTWFPKWAKFSLPRIAGLIKPKISIGLFSQAKGKIDVSGEWPITVTNKFGFEKVGDNDATIIKDFDLKGLPDIKISLNGSLSAGVAVDIEAKVLHKKFASVDTKVFLGPKLSGTFDFNVSDLLEIPSPTVYNTLRNIDIKYEFFLGIDATYTVLKRTSRILPGKTGWSSIRIDKKKEEGPKLGYEISWFTKNYKLVPEFKTPVVRKFDMLKNAAGADLTFKDYENQTTNTVEEEIDRVYKMEHDGGLFFPVKVGIGIYDKNNELVGSRHEYPETFCGKTYGSTLVFKDMHLGFSSPLLETYTIKPCVKLLGGWMNAEPTKSFAARNLIINTDGQIELVEGSTCSIGFFGCSGNYKVDSSDKTVVTAEIRGAFLDITGLKAESATITLSDVETLEKVTILVKVYKGANSLELESNTCSVKIGETAKVTIVKGSGSYELLGFDKKIIDARVDNSAIIITGVSLGRTYVMVKDKGTDECSWITVEVAEGSVTMLQLSISSLSLTSGNQEIVEITSGSGNYSIESVVPSGIVTAEISDNSIAIEAHKAGTAIITVKDTKSGQTATIEVTVIDSSEIPTYLTCPDGNHPHLIDLGLPSGTKWSCCNVGAHSPEDFGGYYAWGETKEKDYYTWTTYTHCDGSSSTCHDIGVNISGTQYDVAHVEWGGKWCMPTLEQFEELKNNTTWKWTVQDGINGLGITSPNGGKLFLPAAGCHWGNGIYNEKTDGAYWVSTQYRDYNDCGYYLRFNKDNTLWDYYCYRYFGQSVRPVVVDK